MARPSSMALAIALFVLTRVCVVWNSDAVHGDRDIYFAYAVRGVDEGEIPYRDFALEYPPLAWQWIALARRLSSHAVGAGSAAGSDALVQYRHIYRDLMLAVDVLAALLFAAVVRGGRRAGWLCLAYVAATAACGGFLYDRLDLMLVGLLLGWAWCWQRSTHSLRPVAWRLAALAVFGSSIAYKLVPLLAVPWLLWSEWRGGRVGRLAAAVAALIVGLALPWLSVGPAASVAAVQDLWRAHGGRGIQVESIYATLGTAWNLVGGRPQTIVYVHGAHEWTGTIAGPLRVLAALLLAGWLTALAIAAFREGASYSARRAATYAWLVLGGTVALTPVLSPQYFIWALPGVLLIGRDVLMSPRRLLVLCASVVAIAMLTTLVYPLLYFALIRHESSGMDMRLVPLADALLALRNVLYVALIAWLGAATWRTRSHESQFP